MLEQSREEVGTVEGPRTIYDNGGRSFDRYTVVWAGEDLALGIGDTGNVPNGFCMTVDAVEGPHLGEVVSLEEMTEPARRAVMEFEAETARGGGDAGGVGSGLV